MLATVMNEKIWSYHSAPDNEVHDFLNNYAQPSELFFDTFNLRIYLCYEGGGDQQVWKEVLNSEKVMELIENIPQADWTQSNVVASDYIKNKPSLATVATSGSYNDLSNKPSIPSTQIQSDWTQASSGALDFIKNKPAARSQSAASRFLNTAFQVSTTRWSVVRYSVDISTTVSLSGSQVGTVILETATNASFTTGVQSIGSFSNGNSGTLVIGLVLTQLSTACLSGDIPPGNYVRLRTVNNTGTPTFTYQLGQEVLL